MSDEPHSSASVADSDSVDPARLQDALATQKDDYLRLAADFDNFRKRTRRESEQQAAAQKESFIRDLLPILDNLERALACDESATSGQLREGMLMTLQQFGALLQRHGIEAMEAEGLRFDPHCHEAVAVEHDPIQSDQLVLEVVQRGYRCGEKVFRPAKVIVNDLSPAPGASRGR